MHMNTVIGWNKIKTLILEYYKIGKSDEGADAYPPLMLFKALLLQKWFRVPSDPELESQINDRISFKKFLNLPFHMPSPDHSTFSRFRDRLSETAMTRINSELLKQFEKEGLNINEGIAVDARLVKSASHPISNNDIKTHRDIESDWTIKNDIPHYGLKEHASVDINSGFWLQSLLRLPTTILHTCQSLRFIAFIPNKNLKLFMLIKAILENQTVTF
ncbi:MAG: transposase [Pseudomonadota bacterium]